MTFEGVQKDVSKEVVSDSTRSLIADARESLDRARSSLDHSAWLRRMRENENDCERYLVDNEIVEPLSRPRLPASHDEVIMTGALMNPESSHQEGLATSVFDPGLSHHENLALPEREAVFGNVQDALSKMKEIVEVLDDEVIDLSVSDVVLVPSGETSKPGEGSASTANMDESKGEQPSSTPKGVSSDGEQASGPAQEASTTSSTAEKSAKFQRVGKYIFVWVSRFGGTNGPFRVVKMPVPAGSASLNAIA